MEAADAAPRAPGDVPVPGSTNVARDDEMAARAARREAAMARRRQAAGFKPADLRQVVVAVTPPRAASPVATAPASPTPPAAPEAAAVEVQSPTLQVPQPADQVQRPPHAPQSPASAAAPAARRPAASLAARDAAAAKIQAWWRGELVRMRLAACAIAQRLRWGGPEITEVGLPQESLSFLGGGSPFLRGRLTKYLNPVAPDPDVDALHAKGKHASRKKEQAAAAALRERASSPVEPWTRAEIRRLMRFLDVLAEPPYATRDRPGGYVPPTVNALYDRIQADVPPGSLLPPFAVSLERRVMRQLDESRRARESFEQHVRARKQAAEERKARVREALRAAKVAPV